MPDGTELGQAQELAALFPSPRMVTIAGRAVEIKRCSIRQAGRIIDVGLPLYAETQGDLDVPSLFDERPEQATALLAAATGLDGEWLASLDAVDQFALAAQWLEVNAAFFVRRLFPAWAAYSAAMASVSTPPQMPRDGPTSSPI